MLPGCHDAMGAKLIQEAGFECGYLSGFAVSATRLAEPDIGLATYNDMLDTARACCDCVSIPLIGDGDTGYGGILNVRRTVHGYARAGLAAISIEDQSFPKRCSYASGVQFVAHDEALERIRAALKARDEIRDKEGIDILIIARSDSARATPPPGGGRKEVILETLKRCRAFQSAGADIVYAEGLETEEEMKALNAAITVPTMIAQVERPDVPLVSTSKANELGFKLSLRGVTVLNAQITATKRVLQALREERVLHTGPPSLSARELMPFQELYETVGFPGAYAWERDFHTSQTQVALLEETDREIESS